jgi:hypothetical protein
VYADIRLAKNIGFYYLLRRNWFGLPTGTISGLELDNQRIQEFVMFPAPAAGQSVLCGNQFPTRLSGRYGRGPESYGGTYGTAGIYTDTTYPSIMWGMSYYRKSAPWNFVAQFV